MWGRVRQTSLRVAQILDASRALSPTHSWKVTVPVAAGLVIASAVMATEEPRLIGFQDAQPTVARLAVHSVDSDAIRPTNVVLRDTGIRPQRPAGIMRTPAVATRNKRLTTPKKSIRQENAEGVLAMARSKREPSLVHQTASIENTLVSTEAVFVVVEGHENSRSPQPVYEIRMWRVTVWHPRVASTTQEIPRKET